MPEMIELSHLEALAEELAAGAKSLATYCRSTGTPLAALSSDATPDLDQVRRRVIDHSTKVNCLLRQPTEFVRHLAQQSQLLACVQWLCEAHVLPCIPTNDSLLYADIAEILDIPEDELRSAARMAATAGFLQEPISDHVAHTTLSMQFLNDPGMLDAVIFLSQTAAPSALQMSSSQRTSGSDQSVNATPGRTAPFTDTLQQQPKLQRQALNYFREAITESTASLSDVLMQLDWQSLGGSTVVDVGAESTHLASTLASSFPHTYFNVQTSHNGIESQLSDPTRPIAVPPTPVSLPNSLSGTMKPGSENGPATVPTPTLLNDRITVENRNPGTMQHVQNAAVYLLHLSSPLPWLTSQDANGQVQVELKAHLAVLRANPASRLVLLVPIQADPTTTDPTVEAIACHRDLSLRQLSNEHDRKVEDVLALIHEIKDGVGELLLTRKLRSPSTSVVGFEMRYQSYLERSHSSVPLPGF